MKQTTKTVKIGNQSLGGDRFAVIAGPCSIESETHFLKVAEHVREHGASLLRGGIFKLRTDPKSFQGLGQEAYQIASRVKSRVGLPLVVEITDPRQIEPMLDVVDCFQVGSRNMHNYALLKELGQTRKPVLLKRGFAALIEEWMLAAEYMTSAGNENIILCERGIRTFETATRNTLDLNAVAFVKARSSFPVVVDPSHGTGLSSLVLPLSLAAAAVGADGLMVEVHPEPAKALSDGQQALTFEMFQELIERLDLLLPAIGRHRERVS